MVCGEVDQMLGAQIEGRDDASAMECVLVGIHHRGRFASLALLRPALQSFAVPLQDQGVTDAIEDDPRLGLETVPALLLLLHMFPKRRS